METHSTQKPLYQISLEIGNQIQNIDVFPYVTPLQIACQFVKDNNWDDKIIQPLANKIKLIIDTHAKDQQIIKELENKEKKNSSNSKHSRSVSEQYRNFQSTHNQSTNSNKSYTNQYIEKLSDLQVKQTPQSEKKVKFLDEQQQVKNQQQNYQSPFKVYTNILDEVKVENPIKQENTQKILDIHQNYHIQKSPDKYKFANLLNSQNKSSEKSDSKKSQNLKQNQNQNDNSSQIIKDKSIQKVGEYMQEFKKQLQKIQQERKEALQQQQQQQQIQNQEKSLSPSKNKNIQLLQCQTPKNPTQIQQLQVQQYNQVQQQQYQSFKPQQKYNTQSKLVNSQSGKKPNRITNLYENSKIIQTKKKLAQQQALETEMEECTFQPKINKVSQFIIQKTEKHIPNLQENIKQRSRSLNEQKKQQSEKKIKKDNSKSPNQKGKKRSETINTKDTKKQLQNSNKKLNQKSPEKQLSKVNSIVNPQNIQKCLNSLKNEKINNIFEKVFDILDGFQLGYLNQTNLDTDALSQEETQIMLPLFLEILDCDQKLYKQDFISAVKTLLKEVSPKEKEILLNINITNKKKVIQDNQIQQQQNDDNKNIIINNDKQNNQNQKQLFNDLGSVQYYDSQSNLAASPYNQIQLQNQDFNNASTVKKQNNNNIIQYNNQNLQQQYQQQQYVKVRQYIQ